MESFESLDNELEKNPLLDWEPMEYSCDKLLRETASRTEIVVYTLKGAGGV